MAAITTYTSYNEVRASVGMSAKELPDAELALEIYANVLDIAVNDVTLPDTDPGPGLLSTRFAEIAADDEADRTAKEQKLYNMTRMFATYVVAYEVAISLAMKAPKMVSDSKASLTRFSPESAFLSVAENIKARLDDMKSKIENIAETTTATLSYMKVASPDTDPVTGL